jgi:hypothetical protein
MTASERAWANYNEIRSSMVLPKTPEQLLTTSQENRHPVEHHNHKRGVNTKHLPTAKVFRPEKPKAPLIKPDKHIEHKARPGEQPIKVWAQEIIDREHIAMSTVWKRISRGKYPGLKRRWVNARIVFVTPMPFVPDI